VKHTQVKQVMTSQVIAVAENTPFKDIVRAMREFHINAVPVIDSAGQVIGIVSAADLVVKEAEGPAQHPPTILTLPGHRHERAQAAAGVAAELMTKHVLTVTASRTTAEAAEIMRHHQVNQLPVIEPGTGRLVGIVTRTDLLRVYDRSDDDIRSEIMQEVVRPWSGLDQNRLRIEVRSGVVILRGQVEHHTTVKLTKAILGVEGVVHVVDQCTRKSDTRYPAAPLNW